MQEDKLTHDERVRLESIAQANALIAITRPAATPESLTYIASVIENYIKNGRD